jgi:hypothetical protein
LPAAAQFAHDEMARVIRLSLESIAGLAAATGLIGSIGCSGARSELFHETNPSTDVPSSSGGRGSGGTTTTGGRSDAGTTTGGRSDVGTTIYLAGGRTGSGGVSTIVTQAGGQGGTTIASQGGTSSAVDAGSDADVDAGDAGSNFELNGAPLIFSPTKRGFGLNVVLARGDPSQLALFVRKSGAVAWQANQLPTVPASDIAQWTIDTLESGQQYEYQVSTPGQVPTTPLYSGTATTQRELGATFTFALITDNHIEPPEAAVIGDYGLRTMPDVARDVGASKPDFLLNLGDMLDFHSFGFNLPPPDGSYTKHAYLSYRRLLGDTLGNAAHFPAIGNWEGEDGCFTAEQVARSRDQRLLYMPAPEPDTYPESGSKAEDYYAFTWGDALFVVLNVMSYTTTRHLLNTNPGLPDDWTLGADQMSWLQKTLEQATSKWRFLFIHHTVGGAGGNPDDSAYGRGGGRAAYVGEQATVHALMQKYGVEIFFYGHDHVFADMVVDDIHYTLPGSAGAPWKFPAYETGYTTFWSDSGYGRVEVSPTAVDVQFVAVGGNVLYEYRLAP